jgi:hypothetical protein
LKNRLLHIDRNYAHKRSTSAYILEVKKKGCCSKCGNNDYRCLDFHHRDGDDKEDGVSLMAQRNKSIKNIQAEIDKCDLLCANCHRILHWEEREVTKALDT